MADAAEQARPVVEVTADQSARLDRDFWAGLWMFREAFRVLVWRAVRVRYKQTVVGVAWVVLRPLLLMAVLTLIFGVLAGLRGASAVPYTLLVLAGVLGWQFFAGVMSESVASLVANAQIIGKIYCPRILFPASALAAGLFDLAITLLLFVPVMLWYAFAPGWHLLWLPFGLVLLALLTFGMGLWAAALNVRYRDFSILIPFALQVGFFVSPVAYPLATVPDDWQWLYMLNAMVGSLELLRWCLLGGDFGSLLPAVAWSSLVAAVLLFSGLRYFHRAERDFADIV
ncbi:MAG: ABC transporter permease [Gammaproteobacteria bacterium]|nr:ABC transporter permease [Gammaproteobacteria bacterium]